MRLTNTQDAGSIQKWADLSWQGKKSYNYQAMFPDRHRNQIAFATDILLPKLKPEAQLLDLGCGDGWFSHFLAPSCQHIDAYDLSQNLLDEAKATGKAKGINNITYTCANVLLLDIRRQYDAAMCMGLLTYIFKDESAIELLGWLHKHVDDHGYLALKDSLYVGTEDKIHSTKKYAAIYRTEKNCLRLCEAAGFELVDSMQLSNEVNESGVYSKAFLFKKASQ